MKRHPFDMTSFLFGAIFAGAAAAYLVADLSSWDIDGRWVLPVALIALGVAGIAGAISSVRSQRSDAQLADSSSEGADDGESETDPVSDGEEAPAVTGSG